MSWLSVAWTRAKGSVENLSLAIPVVGASVAGFLDGIHTGDEHQDPYTGQWVSNTTGQIVVAPPTGALKAQIDATQQFNRDELNRVRGQLADLTAKAGLAGAARIGPPGNVYQRLVNAASTNPLEAALAAIVVVGVLYVVLKKGR